MFFCDLKSAQVVANTTCARVFALVTGVRGSNQKIKNIIDDQGTKTYLYFTVTITSIVRPLKMLQLPLFKRTYYM